MKKLIIVPLFVLLLPFVTVAQKVPYKVVFDMTSHDTVDHRLVIRWINEVLKSDPTATAEVVFYGKSLSMVKNEKSTMKTQMIELMKNKNVSFKVCAIAMKNNNVDPSELIPGVLIVPDGIYEIISRQADQYGYIKVSH